MDAEIWASAVDAVRPSTWITDLVIVLASVVVFVSTWHPAAQALLTRRAQRAVSLPLPSSFERLVRRRQVRRLRAFVIGGLAGLLMSTALVRFIGADRAGPAVLMLLCGFAVCGALGTAIAALLGEATRPREGVRVAHVSRRRLSEYVPRWTRLCAWTSVAVSTALVALLGLLSAVGELRLALFPESFSLAVLLTCLALVALGAFELGGRLIVRRRQTTSSEIELAWDDSLRSGAVRDLLTATLLLGASGIWAGMSEIALAIVVEFNGHGLPSTLLDTVLAGTIVAALIARARLRSSRDHRVAVDVLS